MYSVGILPVFCYYIDVEQRDRDNPPCHGRSADGFSPEQSAQSLPIVPNATSPIAHVLEGYRQGAFPMTISHHPGEAPTLGWYESDPRGVIRIEPEGFHVPRRLQQLIRQQPFLITSDLAFGMVIRACSDPSREGGWIDTQIISIFHAFFQLGLAHSIEAWIDAAECPALDLARKAGLIAVVGDHQRVLVGGMYGLCVGAIFCGESMFSRPDLGGSNASKMCMANAFAHLKRQGFVLLDTQLKTDHLAKFGCTDISREAYHQLLRMYRDAPCTWGTFSPL